MKSEPAARGEVKPGRGKKRRHSALPGRGLWILVGTLFFIGLVYLVISKPNLSHFFNPVTLWNKLGRPVIRTTVFISAGLLAGQLIESLGWTARLGRLVWPLLRWARLPGEAGAAFTSAFISGVLANTLLYTAWQEGHLDKKGLILSNLLCNSLPMFVLHLPTTLFITLSLTGKAGAFYLLLMFGAALLRLAGVSLVSRFIMPECDECKLLEPGRKRPLKEVWADTWPKFRVRLKRLILIIIPVYLAVALLAESGFFDWLRDTLTHEITSTVVPVEAMSLVIFSLVAEFTSGFAAAGALMQSAAITVKQAVLALVIGNVISTPIRALRHQMPQYMGIFTPGLGIQIIVIGQAVRVASVILAAVGFAVLYQP